MFMCKNGLMLEFSLFINLSMLVIFFTFQEFRVLFPTMVNAFFLISRYYQCNQIQCNIEFTEHHEVLDTHVC